MKKEIIKVLVVATAEQLREHEIDPDLSGMIVLAWDWGYDECPKYGNFAKIEESFNEDNFYEIPTKYLERV